MTTAPDQPLGEVLRDGDRRGLRFVRDLAHPQEKVWRAITESDGLRHWLPCDIVGERRAGAEVELPFWPDQIERYHLDGAPLTGRITAWDPPSTFAWTWGGDELTFELAPMDAGTRLTFTTWLEDSEGTARTAGGYHVCFDKLRELLDTGSSRPLVEADAESHRWEEAYAALTG